MKGILAGASRLKKVEKLAVNEKKEDKGQGMFGKPYRQSLLDRSNVF
jgi:hypothetical protein